LGGDEFAILGIGLCEDDARLMTDRIMERLRRYNDESDKPYEIACSIGIAPGALDGSKPLPRILAEADEAMYKEKQRRKAAAMLTGKAPDAAKVV
jgi:GGDEF domain-containing protein